MIMKKSKIMKKLIIKICLKLKIKMKIWKIKDKESRETLLNSQDKDGFTPLHLAVLNQKLRTVRKLLHFEAKKNIKDFRYGVSVDEIVGMNKKNKGGVIRKLRVDESVIKVIEGNSSGFGCVTRPKIYDNRKNDSVKSEENDYVNIFEKRDKISAFYEFYASLLLNIKLLLFLTFNFIFYAIINTCITHKNMSFLYNFSFFIYMLLYILLLIKDPGFVFKRSKLNSLKDVLEIKFNDICREPMLLNYYCPFCVLDKKTYNLTHCLICDKCVEDFDHHCNWIGKCISERNFNLFYSFFLMFYSFNALNSFLLIFLRS